MQIKFNSNSLFGIILEGTRNIQYCVFCGLLIDVPVPESIYVVYSVIFVGCKWTGCKGR